jgi:C-terminal processing protease CtpA/Prc
VIHVGDRLLAINGQALLGLSREDAVLLLKHAHDQVSLQIEYDVCRKGKMKLVKSSSKVICYRQELKLN